MSKKKKKTGTALVAVSSELGSIKMSMGNHIVVVEALFRDPVVTPRVPGPWEGEADKIAWTDPIDGFGCIIRRNERFGHLGGYVGIGPSHPLFGWERGALEGLGFIVHGGIGYAAACMHWERESRSICHVVVDKGPVHTATHASNVHDDLWWIGFECDQPYDVLPNRSSRPGQETLAGAADVRYRDQAYVYEQCRSLASQMAAVARGCEPSAADFVSPPAILSDPRRGISR